MIGYGSTTYDKMPDESKQYFSPLKEGGFVRSEANDLFYRTLRKTGGDTREAFDILRGEALEFKPTQLMIRKHVKEAMSKICK